MEINEEKMHELLIEYAEGTLKEGALKTYLAQKIKEDPEVQQLYQEYTKLYEVLENRKEIDTPKEMKEEFDVLLQQEISKKSTSETKVVSMFPTARLWRAAAVVTILAIGGAFLYTLKIQKDQSIAMDLLKEELNNTKMEMQMAMQSQSASERMKAVKASYSVNLPESELISVLIEVLQTEQNANVKMASIEGLSKFKTNKNAKSALLGALKTEADPIVKISLIHALVDMEGVGAIPTLDALIEDENMDQSIKDEAHIIKLSLL